MNRLKTYDSEPILVEVRCKVCGRLLDRVVDAPASEQDWTTYMYLHICPRHGEGGGHGKIGAWIKRRRRQGKPSDRVQLGHYVPWSTVRESVEKARRTGRTQVRSM